MGFVSFIGRLFVVVINLILLIVGLALFGGGMFIRFGQSITEKWLKVAEDQLKKTIQQTNIGTTDGIELDVNALLLSVSLVLIFLGLLLMIFTFMGCCGACYKIEKLLKAYVFACIAILVVETVAVIIIFASAVVRDAIKTALKAGIEHPSEGYAGLGGTNLASIGWNIVMIQGKCCGVNSSDDFQNAPLWNKTTTHGALQTPIVCCKTLPSGTTTAELSCALTPTDSDNFMNTGCFNKYWDWTLGNVSIVAPILGGLGAFQLLLIISGVVVIKSDSNNKKNKVSPVRRGGDYDRQRW